MRSGRVALRQAPEQQLSDAVQLSPPHEHPPPTQSSPSPQACPHVPQFAASPRTSTQRVPQHSSPVVHGGEHSRVTQVPRAQIWPAAQPWLHDPQFAGSSRRFTQSVPQQLSPGSQVHGLGTHRPVRQT